MWNTKKTQNKNYGENHVGKWAFEDWLLDDMT